ncbi:MAG: cytochrome d ubiquinol oxidase subunit II [Deltaproteobacteria bacterium]|nr:cytochrome d ubiquinol oxidase subunit II [Deltaproteobacteria bacterium]
MTIWIAVLFLAASLYLYFFLGGADFGAGALQFFIRGKHRDKCQEIIGQAMGPVWEANHIWLIIATVILLAGFSKMYSQMSIYFHIPLILLLLGIVCRGTFFAFQQYDSVHDKFKEYYSEAFSISSLITPIMFGMIIGGMVLGRLNPAASTYTEKFVFPWLNIFSFSIGFFLLSLFVFVASIFLIGECQAMDLKKYFSRMAFLANILTVFAGGLVFLAAQFDGLPLFPLYFYNLPALLCLLAVIGSLYFMWKYLSVQAVWPSRILAGFQLALIFLAWSLVFFPTFLRYKGGSTLSIFEAAAPPQVLFPLVLSLICGAAFFLPALFYLFRIFKIRSFQK